MPDDLINQESQQEDEGKEAGAKSEASPLPEAMSQAPEVPQQEPTGQPVDSTGTDNSRLATWSLVLSIIGLLLSFFVFSLPFSILGLIFAAKSMKSKKHGTAVAGLVISILGLAILLIFFFSGVVVGFMQALNKG